jgi:hypothetical protein
MIDKTQDTLDEILKRLDRIEEQIRQNANPPIYTNIDRYLGYDLSTTCSKCGMVWEGLMSYSCAQSDCPMQFKAT